MKQNKTLKLEFSEKTSRQFVPFLIISDIKNGRLSFELKRFLLRKNYFSIFEKTKVVSINFKTKIDSWTKFERNRFFDSKRTASTETASQFC